MSHIIALFVFVCFYISVFNAPTQPTIYCINETFTFFRLNIRICFRVIIAKNVVVLFDDFSFQKIEGSTPVPTEPTLTVSPTTFTEVSTRLNVPVDFPTVTIKQANLSNPVTVTITGKNANQFSSSVELTTEPTQNVVFTYTPTEVGRHTATVTVESAGNYELTQTFQLKGYCIDPNNPPSMSISPATVPAFTAQVDEQSTSTIVLSSENCIDYIYASVSHIEGAAFSISNTLFIKNISNNITVTFAPKQERIYAIHLYEQPLVASLEK